MCLYYSVLIQYGGRKNKKVDGDCQTSDKWRWRMFSAALSTSISIAVYEKSNNSRVAVLNSLNLLRN